MKNTSSNRDVKTPHLSKNAKKELSRRSKEIALESTFGAWSLKNGCSEDRALGYLEQLAIMMQVDPNTTNLSKWKVKYGITKTCLRVWKGKYPNFKQQYEDLKDMLADRMEDYSLWKRVDFQTFRMVAPRYSEDFKNLEEWRAKLKDVDKKAVSDITIRMVEIPRVIEKKHEETNKGEL